MGDEIDQSSFASILAGVRKMRQEYDVAAPEATPVSAAEAAPEANQASEAPQIHPQNGQKSQLGPTGNIEKPIEPPIIINRTPAETPADISGGGVVPRPNTTARPGQNNARPSRRGPDANVHSYTKVQVAQSQKGNPLLESPQMKLTPWSYNGQILSDYYINATVQVLFLSLKYHKLRPEYIWRRLEKLKGGTSSTVIDQNDQALRVLLVVVDIDSPQEVLRKVCTMCIKNDLTMITAWSFEEAGNYVAALKANEMARTKVDSTIQGVKKSDYNSNIVDSLTTVRAVNKTDVANLLANCKSFKQIVLQATSGDGLSEIPGLGERKVTNLNATFSEPFVFNKSWS